LALRNWGESEGQQAKNILREENQKLRELLDVEKIKLYDKERESGRLL
jgi:hypothetical protein